MKDASMQSDILLEFREQAAAVVELAKDGKVFGAVYKAFRSEDPKKFRAALDRAGLLARCHLICQWIRFKECIFLCWEFCGIPKTLERPNPLEFAKAVVRVLRDEAVVKRLSAALENRDAKAFRSIVAEFKLQRYCHFFCRWLCVVRYRLLCRWMCIPSLEKPNLVNELILAGEALSRLLENQDAFQAAVKASNAGDSEKLGSAVRSAVQLPYCHLICEWFCSWRCTLVCLLLLRRLPAKPVRNQIREALSFAESVESLVGNSDLMEHLNDALASGNAKSFDSAVRAFGLQRYSIQLCHWICSLRCHRFCILVCPPSYGNPWFTHVGDFGIYADIASGTGLTNKVQSGHGGPGFGFFGGLSLRGWCPKYHPAYARVPNNQMAYRFLFKAAGASVATPVTDGFVSEVLVGSRLALWNGSMMIQTVRIKGSGSTSPTPPVGPPGPTPPDHFIVPDPQGWINVDRDALDDGFNGWLMGLDSAVAFPGGFPSPGVLAGTAVPAASQRNGLDVAIIFQATRLSTIGAVNSGSAPDFTNQLARCRISNWDEVNLLDLQQFVNPGATGCSPLSNDLDILYTVDHELLADWHFGLVTASNMTLTSPPSGPNALHPRGDAGTYHEDISSWPMCSYALQLITNRKLTTGLVDSSGKVNQKTFCIGKRRQH